MYDDDGNSAEFDGDSVEESDKKGDRDEGKRCSTKQK